MLSSKKNCGSLLFPIVMYIQVKQILEHEKKMWATLAHRDH